MSIQSVGQSIMYASASATSMFQTESSSSDFEEIKSAAELMVQDDSDGDGALAIDETPLSEEMFNTADSDGDGYLSEEELEDYLASGPGAAGSVQTLSEMDASAILESDDEDEDGVLSFEETPLTEEMFATADSDGDGFLSEAELEDYINTAPGAAGGVQPPPAMDAASIIEDEDEDEDGVLSIDETSLTEEMFATADSDGDGVISAEELEAYLNSAPEGNENAAGPPPGGPPPEEDDNEEENTNLSLLNSIAISAYESVSTNFMSLMTEESESSNNNLFASLVV